MAHAPSVLWGLLKAIRALLNIILYQKRGSVQAQDSFQWDHKEQDEKEDGPKHPEDGNHSLLQHRDGVEHGPGLTHVLCPTAE